ncbi:MAG: hypothetical protein JWO79_5014 [Actinomycetia bacterium]|nr:hypothetical protein [Actinomycetes bacterium]
MVRKLVAGRGDPRGGLPVASARDHRRRARRRLCRRRVRARGDRGGPAGPAARALPRRGRAAHGARLPVDRRERAGGRAGRLAPVRVQPADPRTDRPALPLRRVRCRADRRPGVPVRAGQPTREGRRAVRPGGYRARLRRLLHRGRGRARGRRRPHRRHVGRRPRHLDGRAPRRDESADQGTVRDLGADPGGDHGPRAELRGGRGAGPAAPHADVDGGHAWRGECRGFRAVRDRGVDPLPA